MKNFRNNVQQVIKDKNMTVYKLIQNCELSRNTIRDVVNDPYKSFTLNTAESLALALDCEISDLLILDWNMIYYEEIEKHLPPSYSNFRAQLFSLKNLAVIERLFSELGIDCLFEPYNNFRSVNIKTKNTCSPFHVNMNMRIEKTEKNNRLTVTDFFFCTNKKVFPEEERLKVLFISLIEEYARRMEFHEIMFHLLNDDTIHPGTSYNNNCHIYIDFSYANGTNKQHFLDLGYKLIPNRVINIQSLFQKKLLLKPVLAGC